MSNLLHHMRRHIHPHGDPSAWGSGKPVRALDIILGLTVVMSALALVAHALTVLSTAT